MPPVELHVAQRAQEPATDVASDNRFFPVVEKATRKSLLELGLSRPRDGNRLEERGTNFDLYGAAASRTGRRLGGVAGRARQRALAGWARNRCCIHLALYCGSSRQR